MGIRLYEHNQIAYESVLSMFQKAGKAAVIHPTGTGKSFIGFKLCEDFPDRTVCWLSPSEYIFKTQLENLSESADRYAPGNIRFFTYAKLMLMNEEEIAGIAPDYIILDEFHRCGAEMWGAGVQRLLKQYPEVPVLGLSATSVRYLDSRRDMADELFDGHVASEMTLGEAIACGILNPPRYVTALYSYQQDLKKYGERVSRIANPRQREKAEQSLEALRRALENAEGLDAVFEKNMTDPHGKYIVFCADCLHMREMMEKSADWFRGIDPAPHLYSVYYDDPLAGKAFADFKADQDDSHLRLLFCIDALNEGIHCRDVSGVILLRPTVSPIIYKQQIGRALSAGKTREPVIFDIVNNFAGLYSISAIEEELREAILHDRYFGETRGASCDRFRILDAVKDCRRLFDELEKTLSASWDFMYAEAARYYEENGNLLPPQQYVTENGCCLGHWITVQRDYYRKNRRDKLPPERIRQLEQIGMCWQTQQERLWEEGFAAAKAYFAEHGSLDCTRESAPKLCWWLARQRRKYRDGLLPEEQTERLSGLGMVWETGDAWEEKFLEAKRYYEEHGNLDIPAAYVSGNGTALGVWYRGVREQYRAGLLPEERQRRLEEIGLQRESVAARSWKQYFGAAEAYFQKNSDLNVPAGYETEDGLKLGVWISGQRTAYRKGKLTEEQIRLLNGLGMSWQRYESKWEEACVYAERYFRRYGMLGPPAHYVTEDGYPLGAWVAAQRRKYSAGKLTKQQADRLSAMGLVWSPAEAAWQRGYEHAAAYRTKNGHLRIPDGYVAPDGYLLGSWLCNQRTRYRSGRMPESQRAMLEQLGMVWNAQAERWQSGYERMMAYKERGGAVPVPKAYVTSDGYPLGEWARSQVRRYKQGTLEREKVVKLTELGMLFGA